MPRLCQLPPFFVLVLLSFLCSSCNWAPNRKEPAKSQRRGNPLTQKEETMEVPAQIPPKKTKERKEGLNQKTIGLSKGRFQTPIIRLPESKTGKRNRQEHTKAKTKKYTLDPKGGKQNQKSVFVNIVPPSPPALLGSVPAAAGRCPANSAARRPRAWPGANPRAPDRRRSRRILGEPELGTSGIVE